MAELFATQQLRDKVTTKSTDKEVERVLRAEVKSAIANSYNVLRTRIDRFGVVQPNIQALEGQEGRIMVEMPGVKEPERVRKLLQGSANLEFWETYNTTEVTPFLVTLDGKLAAAQSGVKEEAKADTTQADSALVAEEKAVADTAQRAKGDLATAVGGNKEEKASNALSAADIEATAFGILQAARLRTTKTEYISCPGCGRTLYDLRTTIARIKEATKDMKGLKIGIMGCIVNGPGEMADADYGYVGAGRGKISLYRRKECVEKNIPEEEAVEKLLQLIKESEGNLQKYES